MSSAARDSVTAGGVLRLLGLEKGETSQGPPAPCCPHLEKLVLGGTTHVGLQVFEAIADRLAQDKHATASSPPPLALKELGAEDLPELSASGAAEVKERLAGLLRFTYEDQESRRRVRMQRTEEWEARRAKMAEEAKKAEPPTQGPMDAFLTKKPEATANADDDEDED